ncbi:capsid protein [Gluconobacter japonicus]|uniref:phage major capsid protein n=1 Tax=Gluconobacter japonicus TaxID=376620 RepID=UPI0007858D4E|nr:phage major capsid protein [Gluconobacter japonicus]KXV39270.1 capsid protein [Gluconobacter japonicus]KXV41962.1 capsid protein [Gluconobacter japonicus]
MNENEYKQAAADLTKATDQVKKFADTCQAEMKSLGEITKETKASADKALTEMNVLAARLTDLEQKGSRGKGLEDPNAGLSLGQRFIRLEEVKAVMAEGDAWRGRVKLDVKSITSASTSGASGTTGLVVADRQPGIVQVVPNRSLVIRDLLMPGNTASSAIDYVRETGFTNNAAIAPEGTQKPQSDIQFDLQTLPVRTIAHWVQASKQILADAPMLASYVDGRLRYGLAFVEDNQLLNGDGTGTNIKGLMVQSTAYAKPAGVTVKNETMIDRLRLAMLQAVLAQYPATGHILNPTDWASIELTKDAQSRYVFANPMGLSGPALWGLPVAETLAMSAGKFMTGAFRYAAQIFDREDATVIISTEDRDNFVKNMVTILAEERAALAVYRPEALINGSFSDLTAAPSGG